MNLILASSSPRRRELLTALGLTFTIIKPEIDESLHPSEAPLDYVQRLSCEKAAAVVRMLDTPAAVLAADTVVILAADTMGVAHDGALLGKPADAAEAQVMLRRLRARPHLVCTSVTLAAVSAQGTREICELTQTVVHMRDYSDAEINAYIATGDPFDKAGGYAIQHEGFRPVARIDGCYPNVVGLPVCAVKRGLAALGWQGITFVAQGCDCTPYKQPPQP
ncbi:MAG: septum formation protein Maf [Chloroflexi bacterium]|nr:septum formation protein Maf [Chloroflexota bacterium]